MGDRTLVRQGLLVSLGLSFSLAASAPAADVTGKSAAAPPKFPAADAVGKAPTLPKAPAAPFDRRPYAIRVFISVDPSARIDAKARVGLISSWQSLVRRFVGTPWNLDIADGDGPYSAGDLDAITVEATRPLAQDRDKVWFLHIAPTSMGGIAVSGREYDATIERLGPVCRESSPVPADAPRALLRLAFDIFAPLAEVGASSAGGVSITVQAAALPSADAIGQVVAPGTVFRPMRIVTLPNKKVAIAPIKATYLRAGSTEGSSTRCQIISKLADPLTRLAIGKVRLVAIGVRPSAIPTRLRYVIGKEKVPAAGYTLTARRLPDGVPREVGLTDREGRIVLRPDFADGLVEVRLLAGGVEPLVEFPFMPGEQEGERTIVLADAKAQTVALETKLNALRDEVIDQVALRGRIEYKLKPRAEAQAWDEVKDLLDQYRKLPTRKQFDERYNAIKTEAEAEQAKSRTAVLTANAQQQLADVQNLMDRYLDDELFKVYEDALRQSDGGKAVVTIRDGESTTAKPAAKKADTPPAAKAATPPPVAPLPTPVEAPAPERAKPAPPARPSKPGATPF